MKEWVHIYEHGDLPGGRSYGAWSMKLGFRRRADVCLERAEQCCRDREALPREELHKLIQQQMIAGDWIAEEDFLCISAVLFSAMAVEGFLNYYGVTRLGEAFFNRNIESLKPPQKAAALLAITTRVIIPAGDHMIGAARHLNRLRNDLVHPKTTEHVPGAPLDEDRLTPIQRARAAVTDSQSFFTAFVKYDPGATDDASKA